MRRPARQVIVERLDKLLFESYRQYLRTDQRACIAAVENLWGKYAVTARQIEAGLMHDLLTGKVPVKIEEPEVVDG